jgi:hypothetical protein
MQLAEQLDRARAMRDLRERGRGGPNPYQSLDRMEDESAIRRARTEHRAALQARRGVFLLATVLIVAGFLLQIAASVPGCCPPLIFP